MSRSRSVVVLVYVLVLAGSAALPLAGRQQPTGDPFSTEIMKVKDGLYVIPGYDNPTGGNVAVRVTSESVIIVDKSSSRSPTRSSAR